MSETWHGGAAAVVTLTFDVDAETPILAQGRDYARHASTMSHQAYGPDVGLPRILDLLDELGVPATFFVPGWVAEHRLGLAGSIVERGHEVAHHSYGHRPPTSMTPQEERADFVRALRSSPTRASRSPGTGPRCGRRAGRPPGSSPSTGCSTTPR
ncbi:polysaccharide deacetylase family protein [Streptosporangium lutulentum]